MQPEEQGEGGEKKAQRGGGQNRHRLRHRFRPGIGRTPQGGHAEEFQMHAPSVRGGCGLGHVFVKGREMPADRRAGMVCVSF